MLKYKYAGANSVPAGPYKMEARFYRPDTATLRHLGASVLSILPTTDIEIAAGLASACP